MNWDVFARKLQHLNRREVATRYAYRALNRVVSLQCYFALALTEASAREVNSSLQNIECRFIEAEVLRRESENPDAGVTGTSLEQFLSSGERCFGTFVNGTLAAQLWLADGRAHLSGDVWVQHDPAWAYSRWAHTRPEFRGHHLHAYTKRRALDVLVREGRRGILSVVDAANFESQHSAARVGCTRAGTFVLSQAGSQTVTWASPGCSAYGLRLEVQKPSPRPTG